MFFELQLPRPWEPDDEHRLFRNALEWAEIGDKIGVCCAWAQEHHFLEEYSHSTAPEVFLSAVSQRTKRMRLGHGVTLMAPGYNHPVRIAERIATLDLVSDGRVEWGTGESSSRLELEGFRLNYLEKRAMWLESVRETAKIISSEPYLGYQGKYFAMPARNVVPKPVQRPHPPMWVACTNRETMKFAARLGLGALTFAFMDAGEARYWVSEYLDTFKSECTPISRVVNPRIAMLAGVMCHRDGDVARARGVEGQQFFKWALAHYYRYGVHTPGRTNLWDEFKRSVPEPMAGLSAVGTPNDVRDHFRGLESAGVDQVIMLQQGGKYAHEHICESMHLLGTDVLPEFNDRHAAREEAKRRELEPYVERAMSRMDKLADVDPEAVASYGTLWEGQTGSEAVNYAKRSVDANMLWRVQVGQMPNPKANG
ncbi:LLM class flavin-dependent oxidoreductase [Bradyrhizobium sp. SZCCHNR2035]|uniref:LLM class flavin-dependent oxidoreductase n=1 Tax=Bradyrhizobium sp. SZCCHNR2035 TaxID=3057386 RepID=UPI002915D2E1|nr:LLM class flavin-dependent oxidoreductase [Bradyrhizobium sp. SZCCHNR2035]